MSVQKQNYGITASGAPIDEYVLSAAGMEVRIINYGGVVTSVRVPDRSGALANVVLGFSQLEDYEARRAYFGAIIGRYGNRIGGARFTLDGRDYALSANDGGNLLHGGKRGFDTRVWSAEAAEQGVKLSYLSPDGEEGFPGRLSVTVSYTLGDDHGLRIDYHATTDAPTPVNLTNHSYFNLAGGGAIYDHVLMIDADGITPAGEGLIPTGGIAPVAGTPFDFRTPQVIGERVRSSDVQMVLGHGYDHNFVINHPDLQTVAVRLTDPGSGRALEVLHHRAGGSVLFGQLPRRQSGWVGRRDLPSGRRLVLGDAALPGFAQSRKFPLDHSATGRRVPIDHDLPIFGGVRGRAGGSNLLRRKDVFRRRRPGCLPVFGRRCNLRLPKPAPTKIYREAGLEGGSQTRPYGASWQRRVTDPPL